MNTRILLGLKESKSTTISIRYGKDEWSFTSPEISSLLKCVTLILKGIKNRGNCRKKITLTVNFTFIQYSCFNRSASTPPHFKS